MIVVKNDQDMPKLPSLKLMAALVGRGPINYAEGWTPPNYDCISWAESNRVRSASDWQTAYKSLVSAELYRSFDTTKHEYHYR